MESGEVVLVEETDTEGVGWDEEDAMEESVVIAGWPAAAGIGSQASARLSALATSSSTSSLRAASHGT